MKDDICVRLGSGSTDNIGKINNYLAIILPNAVKVVEKPAQICIGIAATPFDHEVLLEITTTIDDIFKSDDERVELGNKLKLVAAELWSQKELSYG